MTGNVDGGNYAKLASPVTEAMNDHPTAKKSSLLQIGDFALSTDNIHKMWASYYCWCCCSTTLNVQYIDPQTKKK